MTTGSELWKSSAESELLAGRADGFWNVDYFERILLPLLKLPSGAHVLDVGAGNGALTFLLARLRPDLDLTGIDVTQEMVDAGNAAAAERGLTNVRFSQGDALHLSFDDATFDAASCQTVLSYLADPAAAIREMSRVVKPGGSVMVAEFHILNLDFPIDSASAPSTDLAEAARYANLLVQGYHRSGQGDLQVGSKVPFLAMEAGLEVVDCRINDRIAHAFPPYRHQSDEASLAEARSWVNLFEDSGYRSWVESSMSAAGGTTQDVDAFLRLLSDDARHHLRDGDYSFLWLINPVLIVTVARKPM